jgi:hypothetical protein
MKKSLTSGIVITMIFFVLNTFTTVLFAGNPEDNTGLKITASNDYGLTLVNTLSAGDIKTIKVNTSRGLFSELVIKDFGTSMIIGEPKLPVLKKLIEIPQGANVLIKIKNATWKTYNLSDLQIPFNVMPSQPSLSKSDDSKTVPFRYNEALYTQNNFLERNMASVIELGTMRGMRLGRLEISPVQYNPAGKLLRVCTSMEIEITFENADIAATQALKANTYSPYFEPGYSKILNYKNGQIKSNLTQYPVKYVIVADPMFQSALQPFVQWKTKKGFTVIEAYTNNPLVGATTTSIKAYLQGLYNAGTPSDPAPSFVLIVGDIAQVPAFAGVTGTHVSDLYYCEYTGDKLPELYYGRFSATSVGELQPQIDKTLEYEKYLMPKPSFLDTCVMIAGQDPNNGPTFGDGQINYGTDTYFNTAHGLYSHTYLFAVSGSSSSQIIQNVSTGCSFLNYTAHGGSDGFSNPSFTVTDVNSLTNNHKYGLLVGNCCLTNKFDEAVCFGEALLRASGKGSLGYIGGSNSTYWDEDYWWGVGARTFPSGNPPLHPTYDASALGAYDRTFHDHGEAFAQWFTTQGQMVVAGNLAVMQAGGSSDYYWEIYHLMGDPSLMIYYGVPDAMTVSYNSLMPLGSTSFTVTTNAPFAYAAISKAGVLYGAALADTNGVANITLSPISVPGTADVVVTCQNRQPYVGTVAVASPAGPYVLYTKNHPVDQSGSDTIVDNNETINLDVTLKNFGAATANGVTATITSTDAFISITDNSQTYGTIASNASSTQTGAYIFNVADAVPDQHIAHFDMAISDNNSNSWTSDFDLKVNAPILAIGNFAIDDAALGNGNGSLDHSETVDIIINTLNNGHADALLTQGVLTTNSPYITITTGTHNFGTLNKLGNADATFTLDVSPTVPDTAVVKLTYTVTSGSRVVVLNYFIPIGQAMEDWETGAMAKYQWQTSGSAPWSISNINPYEGLYCNKSGTILDDQQSDLFISMNVTMADTISFFRKVSCEQGSAYSAWWDFLEFSIDGVNKQRWDGELGWAKAEFPVTTGAHTFKWSYVKDYSTSSGSDAAWIDFIMFPPIMAVSSVEKNISITATSLNCYPNPAQGITSMEFTLASASAVSLKILDIRGREVRSILNNHTKQAGTYTLLFDASQFEAGIYSVVLVTDDKSLSTKLVVIN